MNGRAIALTLACLCSTACQPAQDSAPASESEPAAEPTIIDPAVLADLLGEALRIEGAQTHADGLLVRLAFEPLIRQTGPVAIQRVQSQGYRLTGIADGSPLWQLGLRDGDVLTNVDGQPIAGRETELRSAWEARPARAEITYLRDSETRTLSLRIASSAAWPGRAPAPLETPIASRPPPAEAGEVEVVDFAAGLRCVRANTPEQLGDCELERSVLDSMLQTPTLLTRQVRIIPSIADGKTHGFKLYGIRPNSMPLLLGLESGDTLVRVNGQSLDSVDQTMAVYATLPDQTKLSFALERKGQPLNLDIEIVDKLSGPPADLVAPR